MKITKPSMKQLFYASPSHHGHLECVDVEGSDLPVAADIVDEFDKAMKPEHPGDDEHEDHKCTVLYTAGENIANIHIFNDFL